MEESGSTYAFRKAPIGGCYFSPRQPETRKVYQIQQNWRHRVEVGGRKTVVNVDLRLDPDLKLGDRVDVVIEILLNGQPCPHPWLNYLMKNLGVSGKIPTHLESILSIIQFLDGVVKMANTAAFYC